MKAVRSILAALCALVLAACSGGSIQSPDFESVLDKLTLSVPSGQANPALGQTVQLNLQGHYTCQPDVSCPSTVTTAVTDASYTATPSSLATVDNTGLVTTKAPGTVTITATKDGITSNSVALQIGPAVVTSIVVRVPNADGSPSDVSSTTTPNGTSKLFQAYGIYSNSPSPQPLGSDIAVSWTSSKVDVATVAPNNKARTTATAVGEGQTTLTAIATLNDGTPKSATAVLTVGGGALTGVQTSLSPATASIGKGFTQQFQAMGTYSDGSTAAVDPSLLNWTSSKPEVATVDATGLATGVFAGAANFDVTTITATLKTSTGNPAKDSGTAQLTVTSENALGCTELFPTTSVATKAVSTLCDPLGALLGLNLPLCGVDNPERVVDADPENYARMFATVGLLFNSYVSLTVTAPTGTVYPASQTTPRRTGFVISNPVNGLVKADILSQFSVTTLKAGEVQETTDNGVFFTLPGANAPVYLPPVSLSLTPSALTVDLLGLRLSGDSVALLSLNATKDFDAVVLTLNAGLLSVNSDRRVFMACANAVSPSAQ